MMNKKRAAMELSMSTVVIVVLALTMLIMGFILIRSIMCGAIGSIGQIEQQTNDMITNLFGAQGGEVSCIGEASPLNVNPNMGTITVMCGVNAPRRARYSFDVRLNDNFGGINPEIIRGQGWIIDQQADQEVSPEVQQPLMVATITLPKDVDEGNFQLIIESKRKGTLYKTHYSTIKVSRTNVVTGFIC